MESLGCPSENDRANSDACSYFNLQLLRKRSVSLTIKTSSNLMNPNISFVQSA